MIIYILSIVFGLFISTAVTIVLSAKGMEHDFIHDRIRRVTGISKKSRDVQDDEMKKSFAGRIIKPRLESVAVRLREMTSESKEDFIKEDIKKANLKRRLRKSGINMSPGTYKVIYISLNVFFGLFFLLVSLLMNFSSIYVVLSPILGIYAAYVLVRFVMASKESRRKDDMSKQLPEVLDMLSISVEAGLGLDQAMIQVVENFEGPLIEEISITNRERSMGRSRREALLLLGDRCDLDEVRSFVRAIVQAMDTGISVKNVLRHQAEYMRQTRMMRMQEHAMKIPIKILFPMILFIFPVVLLVLLGPAFLSMKESGFL